MSSSSTSYAAEYYKPQDSQRRPPPQHRRSLQQRNSDPASPPPPQPTRTHSGHGSTGHMPPRSYPTVDVSAAAYEDDNAPGPDHAGPSSRSETPASGNYYTTLGPQDRHHLLVGQSSRNSLEPSPQYAHGLTHAQTHSPEPRTPDPRSINGNAHHYPSTLKVVQWTPQYGEEGSQVTIILDALAVNGAPATQYSLPVFGAGSPANAGPRDKITRRFVVIFGMAVAPTKFTRAQAIDGNGVGQSMSAGPDEEDAFVVLSTFVPARSTMGPRHERIMVIVRVVDEADDMLEECIVGEWDAAPLVSTPPRYLKRPGDELVGDRDAPALRSPMQYSSAGQRDGFLSPPKQHLVSPHIGRNASPAYADEEEAPLPPLPAVSSAEGRHPPLAEFSATPQPDLLRTSQIPLQPSADDGVGHVIQNKAVLKLQGDLNQMAMGWSNEEWTNRRRLIQFWRQQEGNIINATFRPIPQSDFVPNSIVISCIFRDDWNECFVSSVDTIYLLEALVGVRFTVEEKNRIRRNLEGFKPMTVSKSKADSEAFFKLIMGFPNPKPRNIEKDVKVFPWKVLAGALKKIISKYSATYTAIPRQDSGVVDDAGSGNDSSSLPPLPDSRAASSHLASPHIGGPQQSQPPQASPDLRGNTQRQLRSPIASARSLPPSPHIPQSPNHGSGSSRQYKRQYSGGRPPGFDGYGVGLDAYASPTQYEDGSRREYAGGSAPPESSLHHHQGGRNGQSLGPHGSYDETPGAMGPPPPHSRSYSEGPRRTASGSSAFPSGGPAPYSLATEYYAQDLAGVNGGSGWANGAQPHGAYDGPPPHTMLRRSSSLEGLRVSNEFTDNAVYER